MPKKLNLETIGALESGRIAERVARNLQIAAQDCLDRSDLENVRSFTISVTLRPSVNEKSGKTDHYLSVDVSGVRLPKETTGKHLLDLKKDDAGTVEELAVFESHETPGQLDLIDGEGRPVTDAPDDGDDFEPVATTPNGRRKKAA